VGWRKGSPEGGEVPAIFLMTGIEIFIDESGDFGPFDARCPYYIVTMVFHECTDPLYSDIQELEYRLSLIGLEEHCVHSSPAIRGEGAYHGVPLQLRRKLMSNFAAFVRKSKLRYKCFFVRKGQNAQQEQVLEVPQFFWGWRGIPELSAVHALTTRKKKSPLLDDLRYNAKC